MTQQQRVELKIATVSSSKEEREKKQIDMRGFTSLETSAFQKGKKFLEVEGFLWSSKGSALKEEEEKRECMSER